MKAIHFGAGNIGRGFIGALLAESNIETIFVDVDTKIIQELNEKRSYTIELAGTDHTIEVSGVSGLHSQHDESEVIRQIAEADLITTAVGPNVLPVIASTLSKGLVRKESPANVIACENVVGGSAILKEHVLHHVDDQEKVRLEENIGFPNATVDRIVPLQHNSDLLTVKVEPYYEWVVETKDIKGEIPVIQGVTFVEELSPYIERKLFTVNTGHAATAYLGAQKGYHTIKQAMDDSEIRKKVFGTLGETGKALVKKHGFDEEEHKEYVKKIVARFENPDLSDDVKRVGRGPIRKIGSEERLVKPALDYIHLFKKDPQYLPEVIAAALNYRNSDDPEAVKLADLIEKSDAVAAFTEVSGLAEEHPLTVRVKQKLNGKKNSCT